MISLIITAYKEPTTVLKLLTEIHDLDIIDEILLICPDIETANVAKRFNKVTHIPDKKEGKSKALVLGFKKAKGDILILTDGDIFTTKKDIIELIQPLKNNKVGAVTARPLSINKRSNKMGYWSKLLTDAAHKERKLRNQQNQYLDCSGYLYAIRNIDELKKIPTILFSEDSYISHLISSKGYGIKYASKSTVQVKYPTNIKDWLTQKRRSASGFNQHKKMFKNIKQMRNFKLEIKNGTMFAIKYPKNIKEAFWTVQLFFIRLWLWVLVYYDINLKKKELTGMWERIESTK